MLRRLWQILGPVICAAGLLALLLFCYPSKHGHSQIEERNDAISLSATNFKSRAKKVRAFSDSKENFVPFFGSSEWNRMDLFHPSMLAAGYKRSYTPYLLGQRGAASLTQYFGMQQMEKELQGKKAVYFISPQWFTKEGANPAAFQNYFSSDQLISFLENQIGDKYDRYAAKRYLKLYPTGALQGVAQKVAQGKSLSDFDKTLISAKRFLMTKEDALFSQFSYTPSYEKKVLKKAKRLPQPFSYQQLDQLAARIGKSRTTNNSFGIDNKFYNRRLSFRLKRFEGSQKQFSYLKSPEYNDLQLVLSHFAQNKNQVIFVIPPVNSKWIAYTKLSPEMYQKSVAKIKYQLESQGFTNICDLSKDGDKPYIMQDTIHIGWRGWLAFDRAVNPFLSQKQAKPNYKLNDAFLSRKWANYTGEPEQFVK